ncbi:TetR family transcriptional regulator [Rhodococcus pyridinivorans KG-16]|uniref:TetR family transcriptional regulator n=1 Tax=Rhodococcus pyridinivorans KG-16 TaxID=1441730 RepID=A0A0V9ULJ2_9NOCA|nr:TetR/AcrR family transcriptional regulator [Rhodococcus pyridinivorans]KSZ58876.1 TetR family transcriptional regulator [Rhodococcus pyridinivorans KG-16]
MPNRLPADERRAQLVGAALELAEGGGVGAVTVRAVAEKAGVSLGVVHYCFDSKEALVVAMANAVVGELAGAMHAAFDVPEDAQQAGGVDCLRSMLHTGLRAMWSAIESTPGLQTLTYEITAYSLRQRTDGSPAGGDIAMEQYRLMDEQARFFLDSCAERCGVEWSLPTSTLARLSLSVLDGVVLRWLVDRDGEAATAELGVVADIIATRAVERS